MSRMRSVGKTVLITGASTGIGFELAKIFDKEGYRLILVSRDKKRLAHLKSDFKEAVLIQKDLTEEDSAAQLWKEVKSMELDVDILVNNAGFGLKGQFMENDIKEESEMMHLNMVTLVKLTKLFGKEMNNGSKIMNVSSVAAFLPGPGSSIYFATKAFVLSFSEALHEELKPKCITVTALCPGATKTNFEQRARLKFKQPAMDAKTVAQMGYDGMMRGKRVVVTGLRNNLSVFLLRFLPHSFTLWLISRMNR
jgi:uncharacterized protein